MRRILVCVGLALALVIVPTAAAQDKDKKADAEKMPKDAKNQPKDKKEAIEKLHVGGEISGKLTQWGASDQSFTVQVTVSYYVLNQDEYKAMIQEQAYAADPRRGVQDRINHARAAADHQSKLYTAKKETVDVKFQPAADMKVRTANPLVFDDKGKPKRLTAKEKAELKGPDKSLPGYTAEMADVHQDQLVAVYLPKKKPGKTTVPKDEKALADYKAEAVMIVILGEPPAK